MIQQEGLALQCLDATLRADRVIVSTLRSRTTDSPSNLQKRGYSHAAPHDCDFFYKYV